MQPGLFDAPACDHLPVSQREFIGEWLVCGRCKEKLRLKDYRGEEQERQARARLQRINNG